MPVYSSMLFVCREGISGAEGAKEGEKAATAAATAALPPLGKDRQDPHRAIRGE